MLPVLATGELVSPAFSFTCVRKHHSDVEEVRIAEIIEAVDRRFRAGVRAVIHWSGYCACCGRRVEVEPA
ncbi:hypothetical protein [Demequina sp.]|uniref:hypothetical protein n=1 Tax=Demequina sp. TaxID=2050685 RepID=UPI0025ECCAEA|nr:hypothetical protein [Demequina sp.]